MSPTKKHRMLPHKDPTFRIIFETVRDGILLVDDDGRYIDANQAACALLGMKRHHILGRQVGDFADPLRKEEVKRDWKRFLEQGSQHGLFRIYRPDGTTRHVEFSAKAHVLPHVHLSIFRDITERNQAERSLRENEAKLRDALASAKAAALAKSQFIANISHEIRTPINGILGTIELLRHLPMTQEQKEYADMMKDSGETLMALVNDLLDFSRMETGKLKLELKDFDVAATVEIVLALFADRLKEKGLRLSSQIQKNVPLQVRGDAVRLRQVLANLVGNATKFTDQGKVSIAITLEKEKASKAVLRFSISDTGPGLSKNQQKMLFQPFSQADPSTMRRHGGTGLGLAISKQLVELMGGTIGLKSSPGQGSTFWFTLPLQKRSRSFQPEKTPLLPRIAMPAQKARILVAEDNRINRIVAVRQLEKLGYVAETAVNGRDVLRRLKKETYDLILMDCQMPFMDGYKATAAIRKMETGRRTPIIAMTAHALEEDRQKCLTAGMDDYISKPVALPQLRALLQKQLGDPEPVDREQLQRVISPSGEEGDELMQMYIKDTETHLGQLDKAIQNASSDKVKEVAHMALGASIMLGMRAIANELRQLQDMGDKGNLAHAPQVLEQARVALGRTRAYWHEMKKENPC